MNSYQLYHSLVADDGLVRRVKVGSPVVGYRSALWRRAIVLRAIRGTNPWVSCRLACGIVETPACAECVGCSRDCRVTMREVKR